MKKYYFLIGASLLNSALVFADSATNPQAAPNPVSQEWVLQQLQTLQAELRGEISTASSTTAAASVLSATDWLNLCPGGQTIDSTTGCTPNCQGTQSSACTKILNVTEIQDQTLVSSTAATGLSVFRLTVLPTYTNNAPTIVNGSNTNNIRCQTYTVRGTLLNNLNDNFAISASSSEANFQQYTAGVDLAPNIATSNNQLLSTAPNSGAQRTNQQYYVVCMSYTISSNTATNVNMDNTLTISWS